MARIASNVDIFIIESFLKLKFTSLILFRILAAKGFQLFVLPIF
jgi:hypothetical protein